VEAFNAGDGQIDSKELAKLAQQLAVDVRTVRRAANDLGATPGRVGFGKDQTMIWTLQVEDDTESQEEPQSGQDNQSGHMHTPDRSESAVRSDTDLATERHMATIEAIDDNQPCEACGESCYVLVNDRRIHVLCAQRQKATA
jgi:predicted phage gp36 major capsid-like protein